MILKNDGDITISIGKSRREVNWKRERLKLSSFLDRLKNTKRTKETLEEFSKMKKDEGEKIKDIGGFVGGSLKDGKRRKGSVLGRSLIALDADYGDREFWNRIELFTDYFVILYSTHKHRSGAERYRLIIPLTRDVSEEEYEAVGRKIAEEIGIEYFDDTTYEASRLMYWPSTSKDGEYVFKYQDEKWLDPDKVLNKYSDWKDTSEWARSKRANKKIERLKEKQGNPLEKEGLVGTFCRAYPIEETIEKFLSDVYEETVEKNRYTYKEGTSAGGLVVYDGKFAYSHHSTDRVSGKLCNSFDLVRIHLFGELDNEVVMETPINRKPSYLKMLDFVKSDEKVKRLLGEEKLSKAKDDFSVEDELSWLEKLEVDRTGKYRGTISNILLILENDSSLKGRIALNEFSHRTVIRGDIPWHKVKVKEEGEQWKDSDDAALRHYIEKVYGITAPTKINDALLIVEEKNSYHPIKEYFNSLTWDGIKRVDTLFIDYLGVEDSIYSRAVTRKSIVAAVGRIFSPGVKFDYMLVIVGKQGIGKSHIISLLGQNWYSDSLNTVQGKEAYEQLQDAWIIEMAELSATKKAEAEAVKHFISKREDIYRVAYGKRVTKFPRQCVFFGTTNENDFLKDKTGNRRFWPVVSGKLKAKKVLWNDLNKYEIDQVWAEAVVLWKRGEKLFLEKDIEKEAVKRQEMHTEESSKEGMIRDFLELKLPENWSSLDIGSRRRFIHGTEFGKGEEGAIIREKVCAMEIWVELFQADPKLMTSAQSREINLILRRIDGWLPYEKGTGKISFGKNYGNQRAFIRT